MLLLANSHITVNIPVLVRSLNQAMLCPVSTWMGDRLGTLGAVGIKLFFFYSFRKLMIINNFNILLYQ